MAAEPTATVQNIWHKIIAGIFAAVVAPVLVAFGVKFSDKVLTPATPPAATSPAAHCHRRGATPATRRAPRLLPVPRPRRLLQSLPPRRRPPAAPATAAPPSTSRPRRRPPASSAAASGLATAAGTSPAGGADLGAASTAAFVQETALAGAATVQRPRSHRLLHLLGPPASQSQAYGKNYDPDKVFSVEGGLLRVSGETPGVLETVKEYSDYWLTVEYKWGERPGHPMPTWRTP